MSLDHILLGLLHEPASGYDLRREFEAGAAHFWSARLSQIYPTLQRMEERGLLTSRTGVSTKGPSRRVYRRTAAGLAELRRWLRSGPQMGTERFAYLGQLAFMHELGDDVETETFMAELRSKLEAWLTELEAIEAMMDAEDGSWQSADEASFHGRASLRMGIHSLRAKVAWCDETIERLRARRESAARDADGVGTSDGGAR